MDSSIYSKLCKISMCPPKESTPESIFENSLLNNLSSQNIAIELGNNGTLSLSEGQTVNVDDTIGSINGKSVYSNAKFKVTEVNPKYVLGKYITDTSIGNMNLSEMTDERMDAIADILKENSYVVNFIKDYILRFRFADIANHTLEHSTSTNILLSALPASRIIEKYSDAADEIIEQYNEDAKDIASDKNVKARCESNNLLKLKEDLDKLQDDAFSKIISQYNSVESFGYSKGTVADFMLYTQYMEYITSDKFYYDDENPYVVELFYRINEFIKVRSKIELNNTNIAGMITNFNTLCNDTLMKYWSVNQKDYYGRMKEIFLYDFYDNNDEELIEAKINDKNRVTLYSKVLDYLKTLTKYVSPVGPEEKYKDSIDVNTLINGQSASEKEKTTEEEQNEKLLEKLKKIAITFTTLRTVETGTGENESTSYFDQYISKDDLNNIFTLQNLKGTNYTNDYVNGSINPLYASDQTILKKYLGALKSVTDNESKILRELSDKAVSWYNENHSKINSGELFTQFEEITWPSPVSIKKDGEKYDFYYISVAEKENDNKDDNGQPYEFTENSVETEYGIDTYNYWLRYCTMATLTHCMLPMYWSTGLILPTGPLLLPVIYIPFVVISGRVTVVIGLGLCGICPLPMILFVNMSDLPGMVIPIINKTVDVIKKGLLALMASSSITVKLSLKPMINKLDDRINEIDDEIRATNKEILNIRNNINVDYETKRELAKAIKEDYTTHKRKNRT